MKNYRYYLDKFQIIIGAFIFEFIFILIIKMIFDSVIPNDSMWSGYLVTTLWMITIIWECFLTDSKIVKNLREKLYQRKVRRILK